MHYGPRKNSLIDSMPLRLVPVVMDNPAEVAICDGEVGLVEDSLEDLLQRLLSSTIGELCVPRFGIILTVVVVAWFLFALAAYFH
jgi:hypothetical protein